MKDASGLESWSGTFFFQFQDYYLEDHPRTCNKWLVTPRWSWFYDGFRSRSIIPPGATQSIAWCPFISHEKAIWKGNNPT